MKRVLLVSVTAGQGHHATASALSDALKERDAIVSTLDVFKYINKVLFKAIDKGYILSTKFTPVQFGSLYRQMEGNNMLKKSVSAFLTSEIVCEKIFAQVSAFNPSVIVSTHPFAAQIIDALVYQRLVKAHHIGIITDYTVHPFWEDIRHIDNIVTCSELMTYRAVKRGIPAERILPYGIPVRPCFYANLEKHEAREQLGLVPYKHTVLFMAGSMGFGDMVKEVKDVVDAKIDLQIACICGKNNRLKEKLDDQDFPDYVHVIGYCDNVHVYMDASDIVITKPGGLTVSEALAKHKPIILTEPIPGQEDQNIDYLVNYGLALRATDNVPVSEILFNLFHFPQKLELMNQAVNLFARTDATQKICDFIYSL